MIRSPLVKHHEKGIIRGPKKVAGESLLLRNPRFLLESPRKLLTLAAILPGVLLYFYIMHTKAASPFKGK